MVSRWEPREHRPARPLSNRVIALGAVIVLGIGAVAWTVLLWRYAGAGPGVELDAIRTAGTLIVGAGGFAALLLAARRQRSTELTLEHQRGVARATERDAAEQRVTELYTRAVDQLGSSQAPVRLGGLHALERLAHACSDQRQTIVDVICAYLRMPYTPPDDHAPGEDASTDAHSRYEQRRQELQVRLTAQRILTAHLKPEAVAAFWVDIDLNLTDAYLHQLDVTNCHARRAQFDGAIFAGDAWFEGVEFAKTAGFRDAKFAGDAGFTGTKFLGTAGFRDVKFTMSAWFGDAKFRGGAEFDGAEFAGAAYFEGAKFAGAVKFAGSAEFNDAKFAGDAVFRRTEFAGDAGFNKATFGRHAEFDGARFGGNAAFRGAEFVRHAVFEKAKFARRAGFLDVKFGTVEFGGDAAFCEAEFGGDAWFGNATFGGNVRFDNVTFTGIKKFDRARVAPNHHRIVLPMGWTTRAAQPAEGEEEGWLYVVHDEASSEQPTEVNDGSSDQV